MADGIKLYIPYAGETITNGQVNEQSIAVSDNSSYVNINAANIDQLDGLPGVGLVTAQKIINGRGHIRLSNKKDCESESV